MGNNPDRFLRKTEIIYRLKFEFIVISVWSSFSVAIIFNNFEIIKWRKMYLKMPLFKLRAA